VGRLGTLHRPAGPVTDPIGAGEHRAFLSHSHADAKLARALQNGLEQLAKPHRTPKIFDVFLDAIDLPGGGKLPDRISSALAGSDHLLVLLSPDAATSYWVGKEAAGWLDSKGSADHVMLALARGDLVWERGRHGTSGRWSDDSLQYLPEALHGAFDDEPLWVDLRDFSDLTEKEEHARLTLENAEFKYNVARLQAPLRGPDVKPSDIVDEDLDRHRQAERRRFLAIIGLAILTVLAIAAAAVALWFQNRSAAQGREARSEQLASQSIDSSGSQLDLGLLLAVAAIDTDDNTESFGRLVNAAARAEDIDTVLHAHERPVRAVAVDPEAQLLASVDVGGNVFLWNASSGEQIAGPLPVGSGISPALHDLEFDPDGAVLAAAGRDGAIHRWDITDPARPEVLPPYTPFDGDAVAAIDFSPDGTWIAATGGLASNGTCTATNGDGSRVDAPIVTIDVASGVVEQLGTRKGCVLGLDVSPTGDRVAVGDQVGVVAVYDLTGATDGLGFVAHAGSIVSDVEFHPDGARLVTAGWDRMAHVWDLAAPERPVLSFDEHTDIIRDLDVSEDGSTVATADRAHQILVWSIDDGGGVHQMSATHSAEVRGIEFFQDDRRLVSAGADRKVVVWHPFGGRSISSLLYQDDARAVAFDPVRSVLISAGGAIDEARTSEQNSTRPGFVVSTPIGSDGGSVHTETSSPVYAVAARDGLVVTGALDGSIGLLEVTDSGMETVRTWTRDELSCPGRNELGARAVAFDESASTIAVGYFDGSIVVIESPGERERIRCARASGPVWDLAFRPNSELLVSSNGDDRVLVWSLSDDIKRTETVGAEIVRSVAFDGDGGRLAVGGSDGDVVLLDADTFARIGQPLGGHVAWVSDVAFHPGRALLSSAGLDGTVVLWNLDTGLALTDPSIAMDGAVRSIAWVADGDGLAVASATAAEVWNFREPRLRTAICEAVDRDLAEYERRAFVGSGNATTCPS